MSGRYKVRVRGKYCVRSVRSAGKGGCVLVILRFGWRDGVRD